MDLLKKIELLINAKSRAALPRRERRSVLDEEETRLLSEIRKALGDVQAKERELAQRIKIEQAEAEDAAEQGDVEQHLVHTRRLAELEHHLRDESIMAINLEEKLAALEEKLALAQEAVEKEARTAAAIDAEAERVLNPEEPQADPRTQAILNAAPDEEHQPEPPESLDARKSRLSD